MSSGVVKNPELAPAHTPEATCTATSVLSSTRRSGVASVASAPAFAWLHGPDAPWMPLVRALLGAAARLCHVGVMLSLPGSAPQQWHSDGPHMHHSQQLGPHALNVFVPLVALTPANGPTEFVPTTHLHWDSDERPVCLTADAGDAILFDYRTKHRGLANRGAEPRPLVYLTYGQPWWVDAYNFSAERYHELPEPLLARPAARDERL